MAQLSIVSSEPLPPPQPLTVVKTDPLPDQKPSAWRQFVSAATEAQPDDAQHNIFRSFYDEAARPIVGMIHDSIVRGDLGEKAASDILDSFKDQAKTFAAHPDIRNLPLVGPAATATANKMQQQYNAGNYQGMIGTAAGFVGALVAPEAHAAIVEKLPAVARAAATAADATAQWGEAAGAGLKAGAKAAAPDLTMAAKIGAPAIIAQRLAPGGAAGLIEGGADIVSAAQAARGIYRGAKAARAAYQDVRAAQATAAEVADAVAARAAQGPRVPIWQQGYADAEAARAAEAARPPTDPLWQDARAAGAATEPPTAEQPAGPPPAEAPLAVIHSEPLPAEAHAPARTPAQKLEDWIDEHTAYRRMQAQDLEWGNRARMADRYAEYFINNKLDPTPENIARATRDMGETKIPGGDETVPMIQERVAWHNARTAAAEAAPEALGPPAAGELGVMRPTDIVLDPRFQTDPEAGAEGFNPRKHIDNYDPNKGGPVRVWTNPEDGKTYVADGFHRVDAARRGNAPVVQVRQLTAEEAADLQARAGLKKPPARAVNPLTAAPAEVGAANASEVGAAPTGRKAGKRSYFWDGTQLTKIEEGTAAPEAKSLTEQQLEASIAAVESKRGQAQPKAAAVGHVEGEVPVSGSGPDSQVDTAGVGGRPPVAAPDRAGAGTRGEQTAVDIPGEQRTYPAQYSVRELDEIQPSHNGQNFQPNPKYGYKNDRNYDDPRNQRKIVDWSSKEQFNPRNLINTAPTAELGPPVIDAEGNVLGGNGRSMILQRVHDSSEAGASYRAELDRTAQHYGIDPASYAHMKQPVLVRELAPEVLQDEGTAAQAITDFNKIGTAALTPAERAIADARGVSQRTLDDIAERMDRLGPDATLAQTLEGRQGIEVIRNLERDGIISPQERAALATEDKLTRAGKERVSGLMLGRFFTDAKQMDTLPDSLRNKLERMAAPLARAETVAGYSLRPTIKGALDLIEEAETRGASTLDDVVNQQGLFGDREYSPDAIAFAKALKSTNPVELTHAARRYAERVKYAEQYQGPGMFNDIPPPLAPTAAFRDSFEHLAK